jgi:hypothetical protein
MRKTVIRPARNTKALKRVFDRPPETPDGGAMALFRLLYPMGPREREEALDFFCECLMAARGQRDRKKAPKIH